MIVITNTAEHQLQQHASRSKVCAIRTRMLQGRIEAKMVLGDDFYTHFAR